MALYDITTGAESTITSSAITTGVVRAAQLADDKVVVIYIRSTTLYAKVGTLSGTTWTWGTEATISTDMGNRSWDVCKAATDKFAVHMAKNTYGVSKTKICSVSGTTITVGSENTVSTYSVQDVRCCYVSEDKVAFMSSNDSSGGQNGIRVATISGTTPTFGSSVVFQSSFAIRTTAIAMALIGTDKIITTFAWTSGVTRAEVFTFSGTTITAGSIAAVSTGGGYNFSVIATGTDKFLCSFDDTSNVYYFTGTVSGDTTSPSGFSNSGLAKGLSVLAIAGEDQFMMVYNNSTTSKLYGTAGTASSGSMTKGTQAELNGGNYATAQFVVPVNLTTMSAARYLVIYQNETDNYCNCQIIDVEFAAGGIATIKSINGIAIADIKSYNGLAIADIKSINGLE